MFLYSEKIIQETIKCFEEGKNLDISEETANEYCNQLAGLFLAFTPKILIISHDIKPFL